MGGTRTPPAPSCKVTYTSQHEARCKLDFSHLVRQEKYGMPVTGLREEVVEAYPTGHDDTGAGPVRATVRFIQQYDSSKDDYLTRIIHEVG